jgi:hypothetical protein
MNAKPHTEIKSVSQGFIEQVVAIDGVPDNFVESAQGGLTGLPNAETDEQAKKILGRVTASIDARIHEIRQSNISS